MPVFCNLESINAHNSYIPGMYVVSYDVHITVRNTAVYCLLSSTSLDSQKSGGCVTCTSIKYVSYVTRITNEFESHHNNDTLLSLNWYLVRMTPLLLDHLSCSGNVLAEFRSYGTRYVILLLLVASWCCAAVVRRRHLSSLAVKR